MNKHKIDLILVLVFFILNNTQQLWEGRLSVFAMLSVAILIVYFIALLVRLIYLIVQLIKNRFNEKSRLYLVLILVIVLGVAVYQPRGLINYEVLYGEPILSATSKGVANCTTSLDLYENGKFHHTSVCFGVETIIGKYQIVGDTILFLNINSSNKFFSYGVFSAEKCKMDFPDPGNGIIKLYKNKEDSIPRVRMCVFQNDELFD